MARRRIEDIFNYGSPVFNFGTWLFDLMALNCIWLLTSGMAVLALLLFLFGHTALSGISQWIGYSLLLLALLFWCPATTALYYTLSKKTRKHDSYMYRDYFRSYRDNFRQAFCLGFLITFLTILVLYNRYLISQVPDMFGSFTHTIQVMQIVIGVEILFVSIYAVAILARLKVTMKGLIRDAFGMAHKHLVTTFLCALVLAAAFLSVYYLNLALILIVVAPAMLCVVTLMEKQVLSGYIPDEEKLEKEMQRTGNDAGAEEKSLQDIMKESEEEEEE